MMFLLMLSVSTMLSVIFIYCCWRVTYPIVSGNITVAGQSWKYRVGRVPFFTAGKQYLFLFRGFVRLDKDGLRKITEMSVTPMTYIEISFQDYMSTHIKTAVVCTIASLIMTIGFVEIF